MRRVCHNSMEPTLQEHDLIISLKPGVFHIKKDDIIIIKDTTYGEIVKRISGIEGDTCISTTNILQLKNADSNICCPREKIIVIPKKSFYVLGDNSCVSLDSRFFGLINKDMVIGKVIIIIRTKKPKD